jgi:WD40 repeat protein
LWGSAHYGATAFDIRTGEQVISFKNPPESVDHIGFTQSRFTFSSDQSKVILSGQSTWDNRTNPAMTVYDIASGIPTQVNVERNGAGAVALSPDNRYLVMGYQAIRVWDLSNLPENVEDRLPIYRFAGPGKRIVDLRFVDNTTIETTAADGQTSRWDVLSGNPVEG